MRPFGNDPAEPSNRSGHRRSRLGRRDVARLSLANLVERLCHGDGHEDVATLTALAPLLALG